MRILVISNLYPPHHIGGYELGCYDVVQGLSAKGHELCVLTSDYGLKSPSTETDVYRWLKFDTNSEPDSSVSRFLARLLRKEWRNQTAFKRAVRRFRPDLIYIWNLTHVSVSLAQLAERTGLPVVYFVSDKWLSRWETDPWNQFWQSKFRSFPVKVAMSGLRLLLDTVGISSRVDLSLSRVQFVSDFLRRDLLQTGKHVTDAEVIHWGVNTDQFSFKPEGERSSRLLYVGQVTALKGLRTLIEAMRLIVIERGIAEAKLTIVGGSFNPEFAAEMRALVQSSGLQANVSFVDAVDRRVLTEVYNQHDILVFPSQFDEAFTITTLEAWACGLPVVATATGGNVEVMRHELNTMVFEKEDARACADHITRLLTDGRLSESLRREGRRMVEENFRITGMIDKVEASLTASL